MLSPSLPVLRSFFQAMLSCSCARLQASSNWLYWVLENGDHILDGLLPWVPNIDPSSDDFSTQVLDAFRSGKVHRVPILMGTNENEGEIPGYCARAKKREILSPLQVSPSSTLEYRRRCPPLLVNWA